MQQKLEHIDPHSIPSSTGLTQPGTNTPMQVQMQSGQTVNVQIQGQQPGQQPQIQQQIIVNTTQAQQGQHMPVQRFKTVQQGHITQQMLPANYQEIQQQMLHQVQQAAATGRPFPPGSTVLSKGGAVGVVTANNQIQITFPPRG